MIEFIIDKVRSSGDVEAIVGSFGSHTYNELYEKYKKWKIWLSENEIHSEKVVSFECEYNIDCIALFLALAVNRNIIVPLSVGAKSEYERFCELSQVENNIVFSEEAAKNIVTDRVTVNPLYDELKKRNSSGIVLFTSGSTGKSKGVVQDLSALAEKFKVSGERSRMLIFFQLDHIGGVNSLLFSLANKGTIVIPENRSPHKICSAIEEYKVDLLPATPAFLNLLLLSHAYEKYDLSSLRLITYGTEPMQRSTLDRVSKLLPNVKLKQTYGLSEVGILRSKSRGSNSLWIKVGGDEFDVKIVDEKLWIRSDSAMLGYLNAPSPFDKDGFMNTGDKVKVDGVWLQILGRESEIINVGGLKVFPSEVESMLLEIENVEDVVVFGESHDIMGEIVAAKIKLSVPEPFKKFKAKMMLYCKNRLQKYKIPSKLYLTEEDVFNDRFKRIRRVNK